MDLLTIGDDEMPIFRDEIKTIKEFRILIERDKGKRGDDPDIVEVGDHDGRKKRRATKELAFIYFYSSFNSSFEGYDEDEKIIKIKELVELPEKWKVDKCIRDAINRYEELMTTPSVRLYRKAAIGLKMVEDFIDGLSEENGEGLNKITKQGALVFSPKNMLDLIKDVPNVVKALIEAEKLVKQEQENIKGKKLEKLSLSEMSPPKIKGHI